MTGDRITVQAVLTPGQTVQVWLRAADAAGPAVVTAAGTVLALSRDPGPHRPVAVTPGLSGPVTLGWDPATTDVSWICAWDPARVLGDGLVTLWTAPEAALPDAPCALHLRPPLGWMNDPNGFSRVGNLWHLCYQHHPHSRRWDAMHWGHAVSDDLLTWRHLPVLLHPGLPGTDGSVTAAFSGTAIPEGAGLRVFFTDHRDGATPKEIQRTAAVPDSVTAGPVSTIIAAAPPGQGLMGDLRDPFAFRGLDGRLQLLLGSREADGGAVLLYTTDDPTGAGGWRCGGVLHRDNRDGMTMAECPAIVPLPGTDLWVLIYAAMDAVDPVTGLRNPTRAIAGRFDGTGFDPVFAQWLDVGCGSYGWQAHAAEGASVAIGWLAAWQDWNRAEGFPTTATLPRLILPGPDGRSLLTPPVPALAAWRGPGRPLRPGQTADLAAGPVELRITRTDRAAPLRIDIDHAASGLTITCDAEGLALRGGATDPARGALAPGAAPATLRLILDGPTAELFADDGRWAAARRLGAAGAARAISLHAPEGTAATLHPLARPAP